MHIIDGNILPAKLRSAFRMAVKNVIKSTHRQHRIITIILKGNNIISIGHNGAHIHSEISALNRAWRSANSLEDSIMLIIRVRKNGTLGPSKPCNGCMSQIALNGIKRITYTTNTGFEINRPVGYSTEEARAIAFQHKMKLTGQSYNINQGNKNV